MEKKDLRVSSNLKELSKIIQGIIYKGHGFTIWQNVDDNKVVIPGLISTQFHSKTELTLEFKIKDSGRVVPRQKIFMFSPELQILIKGQIKIVTKSRLKVVVDKKFYLKEKRVLSRIDVKEKNMYASIDRKIEQQDSFKAEQVKIKDVSDGGCGFYITSSRAVLFQPDSVLVFNSIEDVDFAWPITGVIRHVTPVEADHSLSNKLLLVGVQFDQSYPNIDTVIQQVEVNNVV
jgi:hypothetical protein